MFHSNVFVGFIFECLLLERKGHYPLPFSSILDNPKGDDLKGRGGENTKNEFILSKLCSRIHVVPLAVLSLSCICNNKVLKK